MKQSKTLTACLLAASLVMSSCNYNTFSGLMAGSSLGGMIGGAAGYIKGGPRGHDRGTAIGILTGAAATGAVMAAQSIKAHNNTSDYQDNSSSYQSGTTYSNRSTTSVQSYQTTSTTQLSLRNVQFFDPEGNYTQSLTRNEECRVTFDIYNPTNETIYNIEPIIYEASGNKQIAFSPSTIITNLNPGNTAHYSAIVKGLTRLKAGQATIIVGLSENGGDYVPIKQFTLTTRKK